MAFISVVYAFMFVLYVCTGLNNGRTVDSTSTQHLVSWESWSLVPASWLDVVLCVCDRCERHLPVSGCAVCARRQLRRRDRKCLRWKRSGCVRPSCCRHFQLSTWSSRYGNRSVCTLYFVYENIVVENRTLCYLFVYFICKVTRKVDVYMYTFFKTSLVFFQLSSTRQTKLGSVNNHTSN